MVNQQAFILTKMDATIMERNSLPLHLAPPNCDAVDCVPIKILIECHVLELRFETKPCASTGSQSQWVETDAKVSAFVPIGSHVRYWLRVSGNIHCDYMSLSCFVKWGGSELLNIKAAIIRWYPLQRNNRFLNIIFFIYTSILVFFHKAETELNRRGSQCPSYTCYTDRLFSQFIF